MEWNALVYPRLSKNLYRENQLDDDYQWLAVDMKWIITNKLAVVELCFMGPYYNFCMWKYGEF